MGSWCGSLCKDSNSESRRPIIVDVEPRPEPRPRRRGRGRTYTVYHGTTAARADSIEREGIRPSNGGLLGAGVYVTTDIAKAWREARKKVGQDGGGQPVVLEYTTHLGKVKKIDKLGHPKQVNWQRTHDTAWVPSGVCGKGSPEDCIKDPRRLRLVQRHV